MGFRNLDHGETVTLESVGDSTSTIHKILATKDTEVRFETDPLPTRNNFKLLGVKGARPPEEERIKAVYLFDNADHLILTPETDIDAFSIIYLEDGNFKGLVYKLANPGLSDSSSNQKITYDLGQEISNTSRTPASKLKNLKMSISMEDSKYDLHRKYLKPVNLNDVVIENHLGNNIKNNFTLTTNGTHGVEAVAKYPSTYSNTRILLKIPYTVDIDKLLDNPDDFKSLYNFDEERLEFPLTGETTYELSTKIPFSETIVSNETPGYIPYKLEKTALTIKFLDEANKELHSSKVLEEYATKSIDLGNQPEIDAIEQKLLADGYEIDAQNSPDYKKEIVMGRDAKEVIYKFQPISSKVNVNYKDEQGNLIDSKKTIEIEKDKPKEFSANKIAGYQVKKALLDGQEVPIVDGKFSATISDSSANIDFIYESIHFDVSINSNKNQSTRNETIEYEVLVKSGMKYETGQTINDYQNFEAVIPIDTNLEKITNIKVWNSDKSQIVGVGSYEESSKQVKAILNSPVKNTDNIVITYEGTIKTAAPINEIIKTKVTVKSEYEANGVKSITKISNENTVKVIGELKLSKYPQKMRFPDTNLLDYNKMIGLEKSDMDSELVVRDTLKDEDWKVSIVLREEMTYTGTGTKHVLENSLYMKKKDKIQPEKLVLNQPVEIYRSNVSAIPTNQNEIVVSESWGSGSNKEGLKMKASKIPGAVSYEGTVEWVLENTQ